jgi:uroporphyrinogen decarboxylase
MWLPPEDAERFLPILCKAAGDEVYVIEWCHAMIYMPEAENYVQFAYTLYDHPEEVDAMAKETHEKAMKIARRAREAGAAGLVAPCDIADTRGLYFTPEQLDRYFFPYMTKWSERVRQMGMQTILHTDGNVNEILDKIAASGVDGLQAIDPVAGMDIVEAKKKVGDELALCGNLHLGLLQNGPVEDIERETKRICEGCKEGGGFVLGATNAVFEEVPAAHYRAMLEAGRKYGSYGS